jgi:transcriptional repressor NrdR
MQCVYCGHETKVTNSRQQKRNNQVWRRRKCVVCKAVFTTHEAVDLPSALLVQSGTSAKPFLPDLLFTEVLLALQDRKNCYIDAREATNTVINQLLKMPGKPLFTPQQISQAASRVLGRLDKRAQLRFIAEHPSLQK